MNPHVISNACTKANVTTEYFTINTADTTRQIQQTTATNCVNRC